MLMSLANRSARRIPEPVVSPRVRPVRGSILALISASLSAGSCDTMSVITSETVRLRVIRIPLSRISLARPPLPFSPSIISYNNSTGALVVPAMSVPRATFSCQEDIAPSMTFTVSSIVSESRAVFIRDSCSPLTRASSRRSLLSPRPEAPVACLPAS